MLRRMSERIVGWQIHRGTLNGKDREVYLYAYELLLNQIINVVIAIGIAVILRAPIWVAVLLLGYIPLRSYSGGYHADSNFGCSVVSAVMIFVVCFTAGMMENTQAAFLSLAAFAASGVLIFLAAPVPDKNKPLDEAETVRYRLRSRVIWAVEALAGTAMVMLGWEVGVVLALGHAVLSLMLCLGLLKNRTQKKRFKKGL